MLFERHECVAMMIAQVSRLQYSCSMKIIQIETPDASPS